MKPPRMKPSRQLLACALALVVNVGGCALLPGGEHDHSTVSSQHQAASLWPHIRQHFKLRPLVGESALQVEREASALARSGFLVRAIERNPEVFVFYVEQLTLMGLPMELALIPIIESSLNPGATSPKGAHGPWQFMAATAREEGLLVNAQVDQRRDWLLSFEAAIKHLQKLHIRFDGDWHLALAAYNCGQGCVGRARHRNRQAGRSEQFEFLNLPLETRRYVARVEALGNIIRHPERYGTTLPDLKHIHPLVIVRLQSDLPTSTGVFNSGLPAADFHRLNPSIRGELIQTAHSQRILLPAQAAAQLVNRLQPGRVQLASLKSSHSHTTTD